MLERQPDLSTPLAIYLYFSQLQSSDGEADPMDGAPSTNNKEFVEELVSGVRQSMARIDALIGRSSQKWRLSRMSVPDRNVLRLACFELLQCPDIPHRVVCAEAIDIARRFGTGDSATFVSGVLERAMAEARPSADKTAVSDEKNASA
jgi:transcription antitermination factor NusB